MTANFRIYFWDFLFSAEVVFTRGMQLWLLSAKTNNQHSIFWKSSHPFLLTEIKLYKQLTYMATHISNNYIRQVSHKNTRTFNNFWRWALHLHLAPAARVSIMLLRPAKKETKCTAKQTKKMVPSLCTGFTNLPYLVTLTLLERSIDKLS